MILLQGLLDTLTQSLEWFNGIMAPWAPIFPELIVLFTALLVPILGVWLKSDRVGLAQIAFLGLALSFFYTLGSLLRWETGELGPFKLSLDHLGSDIHGALLVTEASQLFKLIFLGVAILTVIGMGRTFKGKTEEDHGEFFGLLMFATLGMMIVASAQELLTLILGIEIASMSSYLLAAFHRDRIAGEASLKYFVIGAIASGASLFAVSLLYGMTGTTRIPELAATIGVGSHYDVVSIIPIVLLLVGIGFKISSVPIHTWAPDVYYGAPAPVAGMLAASSKAMGFAAIFNVFLVGLWGVKANWQLAVALIATITMFVGNLIALQQQSIRRMLAYSSIAQAGYVLIALAVGTWYALGGGILHLIVNAAMKLGAFLIVGALLVLGLSDRIDDWKGLGKRAPFLAFAMTIFLLSMAGLPPFGGFVSKFVLFSSAVDVGVVNDLGWLVWLAVIAVLNSAISLYYYVRVIRTMYVEDGDTDARLDVPLGAKVAVGVCLVAILFIGFWAQPVIDASMEAAQVMLGQR